MSTILSAVPGEGSAKAATVSLEKGDNIGRYRFAPVR